MGLDTRLKTRVRSTSASPSGALTDSCPAASTSCTGNKKLASTAIRPARKVPARYSTMMDFMLVRWPCLWWQRAEATRKNTSMGATAFRAPTNRSPRMVMPERLFGATRASRMPTARPRQICLTRLMRFQLSRIFFKTSTSFLFGGRAPAFSIPIPFSFFTQQSPSGL